MKIKSILQNFTYDIYEITIDGTDDDGFDESGRGEPLSVRRSPQLMLLAMQLHKPYSATLYNNTSVGREGASNKILAGKISSPFSTLKVL